MLYMIYIFRWHEQKGKGRERGGGERETALYTGNKPGQVQLKCNLICDIERIVIDEIVGAIIGVLRIDITYTWWR